MVTIALKVINGCINAKNVKDHVIVYTRILNNINLQNAKRAASFIDMVEGKVDQEAVDLLTHYRDKLAMKKMENEGGICKRHELNWVGREGLSEDTHKTYLSDFITHFYKNVVKLKEVIRENNRLYFVFEYVKGDLLGLMRDTADLFTEAAVRTIIFQILQALAYMHRNRA